MNGIALHGGFIPYGGTFLTFSDYSRNAIRMAALMKLRVVHVFTHDSIGLGEDGPTHQSVEHAASLRLIPQLDVWRPADPIETAIALTAVVHFLNNLFKLSLVWKHIHRQTVLRFGLPSLAGAFAGALVLLYFPSDTTLFIYSLWGNIHLVTSLKLVIAILIIIFALFEALDFESD